MVSQKKIFRNIMPLRVRGSVWHIRSREQQSGFFGKVCTGESPSSFSGQTEW